MTRFKIVMDFTNRKMDFDIILYDDNSLTCVRFTRRNIVRSRNQYGIYVDIGRMLGLKGTKADRDFVAKYVDALKRMREWFKPLLDIDNGTFTINDYILNTTVPLNSIKLRGEIRPNVKKSKREIYSYKYKEDLHRWQR